MPSFPRQLSQFNQVVNFVSANDNLVLANNLVLPVGNVIFGDGTTINTAAGLSGSDQFARNQANAAFIAANNSLSNVSPIITVNGSSVLYVSNTSPSISNSTGALIVNGGIGASGNVYIKGQSSVWAVVANSNNYQLSMSLNDSLGSLAIGWGTNSSPAAFMSMTASGGRNQILNASRDFRINHAGGDSIYIYGSQTSIQLSSTEASTSNITGALKVAGGLGVKGNVYADAVYDGGVEVIQFANNSYNQANAAFITANTANDRGLSAGIYANGAFAAANSATPTDTTQNNSIAAAFTTANSAGIYANGAFTAANTADTKGTSAGIYANGAFIAANSSGIYANGAFSSSNNRALKVGDTFTGNVTIANGNLVISNATTAISNMSGALIVTGGAGIRGNLYADGVYSSNVELLIFANGAYSVANSGSSYANSAFAKANNEGGVNNTQNTNITSASTYANGAFGAANTADTKGTSAGIYANGAFTAANNAAGVDLTQNTNITSSSTYANGAFAAANTADSKAVTAGSYANSAFASANNAAGVDLTQNTNITNSGNYANGAFTRANNSLSANSGGTVTGNVVVVGDFSVTGNLIVTGNTFRQNVSTLEVVDPLIYLAANNYSSDIVDIGFAGNYYDAATPSQRHAGLFRRAVDKVFYVFDNYQPEPNNVIDLSNSSFRIATLNANIVSQTVTVRGVEVLTYANGSFESANSAGRYANGAFTTANTANDRGLSAGIYANGAFALANSTVGVDTTQNTNITNSGNYANGAFTVANTASDRSLSAGIYANGAFTTANTANDRGLSAGIYANGAFALANSGVGVDTTQNTNITNSGNYANGAFTTANTANDRGLSAGIYANGAFIRANNSINNTGSTNVSTLKINALDGNFEVSQNVTSWTNSPNHPIIRWSFNAPYDDNLYFASGGNSNTLTQSSIIISESQGVLFGKGPLTPGSNTFPLSNEWMRVNNNILTVNGTANIQSTTDSTSRFTGALRVAGGVGVVGNVYAAGVYDGDIEVLIFANNSYNTANASFGVANTANDRGLSAGIYANGAFALANSINGVDTTQNTNITNSGNYANGAFTTANTANDRGLSAGIYANGAFTKANNEGGVNNTQNTNITSASTYANGAFSAANTADGKAVTSGSYANSAYTRANNSLNANTGGVIQSSITVQGTLTTNGGASLVQIGTDAGGSISMGRQDNIATNPYIDFNPGATTVDYDVRIQATAGIGVVGKGNLTITAAELISTGNLSISAGFPSTSTTTGSLRVSGGLGVTGNIYADAVYDGGVEIIGFAGNAFNQANAAFTTANTANDRGLSAGIYANGAFALANAGVGVDTTQNTNITNVTNTATAAFLVANTANDRGLSAGIYANGAFALANAIVGVDLTQNTNITNSGNYANGAFVAANSSGSYANAAFAKANTGGLTIGNELTSSSTFYPLITTSISGTVSFANVDSTSLYFVPSTGTLSANVYVSLSDKNYKNNIIRISDATNTIIQIEGVSFNWNHNNAKAYGVIAQDVENVIPELVHTNEKGIKTVNYDSFIPFLIESIKEQKEEIENLKKQIQTINSRLGA